MAGTVIRGYRGTDEAALLEVWAAALPYDTVDRGTLHREVLLDPNFDPEWLLVAEVAGEVAGFCLCVIRREPLGGEMEPERGWVTAFGVAPGKQGQGIGSALLDIALDLFREAGRDEALLAPYVPNYFVPGVDEVAYAEGLAFLKKRGFEVTSRPLSMDASIVLFDHTAWDARERELLERGVEVRALQAHETPEFMRFMGEQMPAGWVRDARELLMEGSAEQVVVALREGEIVGYCQFRGEHFGPFGVIEDCQGQGIGTVLLARCLRQMQRAGLHNAWVLWTSDETAERVYSKLGFRETRRFSVLRRVL